MTDIRSKIFCGFQYLLPQQLLSRLAGQLAETSTPWLRRFLINLFIRHYQVDVGEAEHQNLDTYTSFNAFFTRALKAGVRPINDETGTFISPADGRISQCGAISDGSLLQTKGLTYRVADLVGDDATSARFQKGRFVTIYLSPKDYHRVHMPVTGTLIETRYLPGQLFSVNNTTANYVPRLFARNERLVCLFESEYGPFSLIMVGAMMVAGIETVWHGHYKPGHPFQENHRNESPFPKRNGLHFEKGAEIGRFKFGSTVILLLPDEIQMAEKLKPGLSVQMGEKLTGPAAAE